ncbi:MAG: M28 family peptidase [Bacteroidia bacterium]|nr:M28 family peptidase [Bacteroidia bacterium]
MVSKADSVYLQNGITKTYDGKFIPVNNIIASFNIKAEKRILLCAHWDTRPFADQDTKNRDKPILGANDGASGVGILMEIAAQLKKTPVDIGVDIIFFDAEDWGDNSGQVENSFCLGSQYWGNNLHVKGYKADFGILLDMVGAPNALFGFEGYSMSMAPNYLAKVWNAAAELGYGSYFKSFQRGYVTDDHFYVMKATKIPMIDIIDTDLSTDSHFGKYWHTHDDNMDAIDKATLRAVGHTLMYVVRNY